MAELTLTLLEGDVFQRLPEIPSESIDLVLTSPPYWGLRNYGVEGQLGAEPTMEAYLDNTLRWVKEAWRVLKPTGRFVLNLGDCFIGGAGRWGGLKDFNGIISSQKTIAKPTKIPEGHLYKPKQLLSVSSFAYCRIVSETDFVCRGEHIWAKPNVPSPIRSRLKHSHEKLFWFVKDADKYYFDEKPWTKKVRDVTIARCGRNQDTTPEFADNVGLSPSSCFRAKPEKRSNDEQLRYMREKAKGQALLETSEEFRKKHEGTAFPTESFHYKLRNNAYGEDQSTTPGKRGCGMMNSETIEHSWRIVPCGEKQNGFELAGKPKSEHVAPFPAVLIRPYITSLCPPDGIILDPFIGSGTTMRVAMEEGRSAVGIDLSHDYLTYAKKRLNWGGGLNVEYKEDW